MMTDVGKDNFSDRLAKIISIVFHPLFIPLYGLGILFSAPTYLEYIPLQVKKILFTVVLLNNVLVPLALFPFFRARNIISSYTITDRTERVIPLSIISILYLITSYIYFRFPVPGLFKSFIFSASILVIMLTVINFWWKISIHSAGAGTLTALVVVLVLKTWIPLTWYLLGVVLIGGFVLFSRLRLNIHNPQQVWLGFMAGFAGSGFCLWLLS